ncbi:Sel1 domain protein repeat-containing protein [Thiorhodococcus drewsii AZ1]|uniref:Sel1 domain protein repeat-containing protein n=1 Tax=Thiorhodococcus drewsii AZ1 TaxID=765913 RepID=G2DVT4_9GAMM|nr:tetratricopeptide repeat protein [Thiorhodococcus drewsii]EGV34099.1 Sel1 domain protein repeat-containing protein [Thiorhodococcus drewsii AZ1]
MIGYQENTLPVNRKRIGVDTMFALSCVVAIVMAGISGEAESASGKDRRTMAEKRCDALAASPDAPGVRGEQVNFERINVAAAFSACKEVVQDTSKPRYWYQMGRLLDKGKYYREALPWYLKAARQGFVPAQYNLGVKYRDGQGVQRDDSIAAALFRKAAEQGDADAQFNLGLFYADGQGVPRNDAKAVAWYRKAASQGLAVAQSNLGFMYEHGRGVPRSLREAAAWYGKAAAQGNSIARRNLANLQGGGSSYSYDDELMQRQQTRDLYRNAGDPNWNMR